MAFINFENLPSENTPLTGGEGGNLNVMQEIVNVSNEVDEDYRVNFLKSKNLLSTSLELGIFTNSGVKDTSTANYRTANMVKVKPNTTYTTSINGTAQAYALYFYTAGGVYISSATTATFTTPANCEYLNFRCFNADFTSDFANLKVQLEEGSTATAYEEFIPNQIVVDNEKYSDTLNVGSVVDSRSRVNVLHSKNLFDKKDTKNGFRLDTYGDDFVDSSYFTSGYIKVKPNTTYTVNYKMTVYYRIAFYNNSKTLISINNSDSTFTTPSNCTYLRIGQLITNKDIVQLNEGSTALPYEPYITPSIYVDGEEIYNKGISEYSSNEHRVGTWLGKPLYRKVVETTLPDASANGSTATKTIAHNIVNAELVWFKDAFSKNNNNETLSFPYFTSAGYRVWGNASTTTIFLYNQATFLNSAKTWIVLEYTKTTD